MRERGVGLGCLLYINVVCWGVSFEECSAIGGLYAGNGIDSAWVCACLCIGTFVVIAFTKQTRTHHHYHLAGLCGGGLLLAVAALSAAPTVIKADL